ncbi:43kDa postsynaptic protein [Parasponia andersonii]|uniref:RING-type E3 ubiquitin transferase n=1 Tax=Parasponia andersonii TaxID=3476 RepID=A0A2P5CSY3_PARAD|nr:43kDa postsynaptic protein [Parasponia andersonii]
MAASISDPMLMTNNNGLFIVQSNQDDNDPTLLGRLHDQNEYYFLFRLNNRLDNGVSTFTLPSSPIISRREYFAHAPSITRDMLISLLVETACVESFASEIVSTASAMASNPNFANCRVLTLTVNIFTRRTSPLGDRIGVPISDGLLNEVENDQQPSNDDDDDDDSQENDGSSFFEEEMIAPNISDGTEYYLLQAIDHSFGESAEELFKTVPASKSSLEALKEAKVDDLGATTIQQCSICLEKLWFEDIHNINDRKVVRMPCSHLYHKHCIVRWLETSHMCPMCRYAMPT